MRSAKQRAVEMAARVALDLEGFLRPRTEADPKTAMNVLVLEYMLPLGSCVHMTPVYEALKLTRPAIEVTVATRGLALPLLRHSPFIDHLIETPDPLVDVGRAVTSLRKQMDERELWPDCCLTGVPDQRTNIALLGARVCEGWRGGFTVHSAIYQHPLQYDWSLSQIANNLRLAAMLGYSGGVLEPKVFYSADDATTARGLVGAARGAGGAETRPVLVVVSQNSGGQQTGWHQERFVEVIRYAHQTLGYAVIYVGTDRDAVAIDALRNRADGIGTSVAGGTSVNELAALLALGDLVLTLDTGTMHVGRAVGTPMVVLGPSWQRPLEWLPLGKPHVRILRGEDREGMPAGYRLDEISANEVKAALAEMTGLFPASETRREARLADGVSTVDLLAQNEMRARPGSARG